tara:strand:- start:172 stop:399 length:228 start_codon:yes stop_codon:yes gene_type:complete
MLKKESQQESGKLIDRYDELTAGTMTEKKMKEIKQQQKNLKRDRELKNVKKQKYSQSHEKIIKSTDFKDGKSPIL